MLHTAEDSRANDILKNLKYHHSLEFGDLLFGVTVYNTFKITLVRGKFYLGYWTS